MTGKSPPICFLDAAGCRLEYSHTGPRPDEAPTLVFLHEGLGCVSLWRDFPGRVAAACGCDVLVYSRAGYGLSDPAVLPRPVRYMHDEGLEVLPAVLRAAAVRRAILVGHSDGGSIALIHAGSPAAREPGAPSIAGVVTLAAHVFNEAISVRAIAAAREAWETGGLRDRLARHHRDNVDIAFRGWNDVWLHPDFREWNITEYLPGVRCPLLAIQGTDDEYGSAAQIDAIVNQAGGPTTRLMLPGCGHAPQNDRPEETLAAIADFVAGIRAESRRAAV